MEILVQKYKMEMCVQDRIEIICELMREYTSLLLGKWILWFEVTFTWVRYERLTLAFII